MHVGAVFPQLESGTDHGAIREYATRLEGAGVHSVLAYDHVLGANPESHGEVPYDVDSTFHEPLTLFSHLAAVTDDLRFVSGVLVLPQRQTALVAKQAATVDVLSGGRLTLGVGVGWNDVEYAALGQPFERRGARIESQIPLLRRLWTERSVECDDDFHHVPDAGIAPRPVQRPIPVWLGGTAEPVLRRAGRLADGWLPQADPGPTLDGQLETLAAAARDEGRDPDDLDVVGRLRYADADDPAAALDAWRERGASGVVVDTMGAGLSTLAAHADAVAAVAEEA
jgi:probable F420-dependent oxidoreductase